MLEADNNFAADKISKKAEELQERRDKNREEGQAQLDKIKDQHLLHTFLQVTIILFKSRLLLTTFS